VSGLIVIDIIGLLCKAAAAAACLPFIFSTTGISEISLLLQVDGLT